MKKVFIGLGIALIVVALVVTGIFLYKTKDEGKDLAFNIEGTWKVLENAGERVDTEFLVFENATASQYRDGKVVHTSAYTIKGTDVYLKDLDVQYYIHFISENNIVLVNTADKSELRVIRVGGMDNKTVEDKKAVIIGKWKVVMQGNLPDADNEYVIFTENTFEDYRNGSEEPFISCPYYWDDNGLVHIETMSKIVEIYPVTDDFVIMLDESETIWEISREQ